MLAQNINFDSVIKILKGVTTILKWYRIEINNYNGRSHILIKRISFFFKKTYFLNGSLQNTHNTSDTSFVFRKVNRTLYLFNSNYDLSLNKKKKQKMI